MAGKKPYQMAGVIAGRPYRQPRWFVGWLRDKSGTEAFSSWTLPVDETHPQYTCALGPMSKRAAVWFIAHPMTTCRTVKEIEVVAKQGVPTT